MKDNLSRRCERRSRRALIKSRIRFQTSRQQGGFAESVDVNLDGMCLESEIPLSPGQFIVLQAEISGGVEMKGCVTWVRSLNGGFRAGIRVYHDEPGARVALCAMTCAALKVQAAISELRERHFRYAEWKLAAIAAGDANVADTNRRHAPTAPGRILALGF